MKSGNLNFLEPSAPLQACNGTDLPLLLTNCFEASKTRGSECIVECIHLQCIVECVHLKCIVECVHLQCTVECVHLQCIVECVHLQCTVECVHLQCTVECVHLQCTVECIHLQCIVEYIHLQCTVECIHLLGIRLTGKRFALKFYRSMQCTGHVLHTYVPPHVIYVTLITRLPVPLAARSEASRLL